MSEAQIVGVAWADCSAQCVIIIIMKCWWETNNCACPCVSVCVCVALRVCLLCLPVETELFCLTPSVVGVCACLCFRQTLFHASQNGSQKSERSARIYYRQCVCACVCTCGHVCVQSLSCDISQHKSIIHHQTTLDPPCLCFELHLDIF